MNARFRPANSLELDARWRVRFASSVTLPVAREPLWHRLMDFEHMVCQDFFHKRVLPESRPIRQGTAFLLEHSLFGVGFMRRGRILSWREGVSYAFSDLSMRDARVGFPHVFRYSLESVGDDSTVVRTEFAGRWTATFLPRETVRLWLYCIGAKIERSVRAALLSSTATTAGES